MSNTLSWLLVIQLIGLLGFPLAYFLFSRLPDRGYALAKPLGLLLAAYLLWLLGQTGAAINSPVTVAGILLMGAVACGWLYYRRWQELEEFVRGHWRYIVLVESLFLLVFLWWAFVISEIPSINHTEKPMDFAFLTAILQSSTLPPEDPWLAGHSISYYYFGHFIVALPMKLAGIPSSVGYNLAMATIPALVAVGALGLTYNLVRLSGGGFRAGILTGLGAAIVIVMVGNLLGVLEFVQVRGWGSDGFWQWVGIKGMDGVAGNGLFPDSNWWWWRSTRVIDTLVEGASLDYTITEFPFFSYLLGDLHSHVLALPFALLALSLTLNFLRTEEPLGLGWLVRHRWEAMAMALSLGALAFINSWDFPVYAGILVGAGALRAWADYHTVSGGSDPTFQNGLSALRHTIFTTLETVGTLLLVAVALFLPFYLNLSSQVSGIVPHLGPGTRPLHFALVIGAPLLLALAFLAIQIRGIPRPARYEAPAIIAVMVVAAAPLLLWLVLVPTGEIDTEKIGSLPTYLAGRFLTTLPVLALGALAGYCAISRMTRGADTECAYPLLMLAAAVYLLAGAELFHLADFFGNRMNTIFKVYYQAWLLLGIVGAYGLYRGWATLGSLRRMGWTLRLAGGTVAALLLTASLYYPVGATLDRTGLLKDSHTFKDNTLDGLAYIRSSVRAEYDAIRWLRDQAAPGVMVEAVGNDYTEYSRVSAASGQPAVLGWKGHEHQWRGSTLPFEGREEDVAQIYQSEDPQVVRQILERYDVRYVYLGQRERDKYGVSQPATFDELLEPRFSRGDVTIYQRNTGP